MILVHNITFGFSCHYLLKKSYSWNYRISMQFCFSFSLDIALHIKDILIVIVLKKFIVLILCNIEFIWKKRSYTSKLKDTFSSVHYRNFILSCQFIILVFCIIFRYNIAFVFLTLVVIKGIRPLAHWNKASFFSHFFHHK